MITQRSSRSSWFGIVALVAAWATPALAAEDVHDSVVIVFDASGSMDGAMGGVFSGTESKMVAAKRALRTVLAAIPETMHIGLLVFSDARPNGWVHPIGPRDDAKLAAALDDDERKSGAIKPSGGTPLGEYMKIGADHLLAGRAKALNYGTYRLVVITDGEATDGNRMEQYAPEIIRRGLELHAIGVAMPQGHLLARYAHAYQAADSARALEEAARKAVRVEAATVTGQLDGVDYAELVAGLDPAIMIAVIDAFSRYPNHPIGERPPEPVAEALAPVVHVNGAPVTPGAAHGTPTVRSGCGCESGESDWPGVVVFITIFAFAYAVFRFN